MMYPCDDVIARGRRVVLRRKRLTDVVQEYAWRSDEELAHFDAALPLRLSFEEYARNWCFDLRFTDVASRSFAIEEEGGWRIGNVMYYNVDKLRQEAEIGILIGEPQYWGRGYGSDASATIVRYVFQKTNLQRLYLRTLEWNQRAQGAFRKAGFVTCGTSWRDGQNFVVMEVRREWLELTALHRNEH